MHLRVEVSLFTLPQSSSGRRRFTTEGIYSVRLALRGLDEVNHIYGLLQVQLTI